MPLSSRALAILKEMTAPENGEHTFIFPGGKHGQPLSNMAMAQVLKRMERGDITVHGFRSTFRDWAAECTHLSKRLSTRLRVAGRLVKCCLCSQKNFIGVLEHPSIFAHRGETFACPLYLPQDHTYAA